MILSPVLLSVLIAGHAADRQTAISLTPPPDLVWGWPTEGLRLGMLVQDQKSGPPILRTWLKNDTDHPILVSAKELMRPASPIFLLTNRAKKIWEFDPPSAQPLSGDAHVWQVKVPAKSTVPIQASRSWLPVPSGTYGFRAEFSALLIDPTNPTSAPHSFTVESPSCVLAFTADQTVQTTER